MNVYRLLADLMVAVHAGYIAFVVLGLAAILLGGLLRWRWVRNFWFRLIHLAAIVVVAAEALLGIVCPLTTWEDRLREAAGETVEEGTFIGRLLHELIFVSVPKWVLPLSYCLFALTVLLIFIFLPPRWPKGKWPLSR